MNEENCAVCGQQLCGPAHERPPYRNWQYRKLASHFLGTRGTSRYALVCVFCIADADITILEESAMEELRQHPEIMHRFAINRLKGEI